jgi:hypothetical protein
MPTRFSSGLDDRKNVLTLGRQPHLTARLPSLFRSLAEKGPSRIAGTPPLRSATLLLPSRKRGASISCPAALGSRHSIARPGLGARRSRAGARDASGSGRRDSVPTTSPRAWARFEGRRLFRPVRPRPRRAAQAVLRCRGGSPKSAR